MEAWQWNRFSFTLNKQRVCVFESCVCLIGLCECGDDEYLCVCNLIVLQGFKINANLHFQLTNGNVSPKEDQVFKKKN